MEDENLKISADEIIKKSKQWTLEGDCTILQWLNQISKNLEERAIKTTFELQNLSIMLDKTMVALSNATNNLAALQYSQFVENRVHDDDETLANVAEVPNPSVDVPDKAADSSMCTFLKKNLEMMNSCHEQYAINYDDSDDDDDEEQATNVIYRPKNPYEARPLPHIYGTTLWKQKWHIGLCDSDNDFSGDDDSEQFSESSSTADESYESTAPTMSEWDSAAWGLNTQHLVETREIHSFPNDGESTCRGENYSQSEASTPGAQRSIPIVQPVQEQKYYQHVPRKEENLFDDIFTESQRPVIPNVVDVEAAAVPKRLPESNFISNEPPPDVPEIENQNNKRVGAKKPLNLFDDDEFGSFMDQIAHVASNKNVKVVPAPVEEPKETKKVVPNLFDDTEDIFSPSVEKVHVEEKIKIAEVVEVKSKPAEVVEDDIFQPPPRLPTIVERTKKIRNLFDDDDEDEEDDFEKIFAATKAGSNKPAQKTTNLFENDLDDVQPQVKNVPPEVPLIDVHTKGVPLFKKGLFDDDENEDDTTTEDVLFAHKSPARTNLLEDPFKKNEKQLSHDLFRVDERPGGATDEEPQDAPEDACEPSSSKAFTAPAAKKDLFTDLFRDEPPEDMFSNFTTKAKTKVADIFADDFTDDFEEFIPKSATKKVEFLPPLMEQPVAEDPAPSCESPAPTADVSIPAAPESVEEAAPPLATEMVDEIKSSDVGALDEVSSQITTASSRIILEEPVATPSQSMDVPKVEEAQAQTPKAVPSYASLFSDEPPSDDDDPSGSQKLNGSKNMAAFSTINLFADVPPDDDFSVSSAGETKRIHSIFYDDFNETIEASREMRAPSTYIFNEEPPPDDDQPSPAAEKPTVVEEPSEKPKVSKLKKTDLQINVAALLPTAKLPAFKKPESSLESEPTAENDSAPAPSIVAVVFDTPLAKEEGATEERKLPENILPNLNRDRARLSVKRRPSTRKGRQERYRKSLIEDEVEIPDDTEAVPESVLKSSKSLFADDCVRPAADALRASASLRTVSEVAPQDEMFQTMTSLRKIPERTSIFEDSGVAPEKEEKNSNLKDESASADPFASKTPSLFEDSDQENIFESQAKTTEFKATSSGPVKDPLLPLARGNENVSISAPKALNESKPSRSSPVESVKKPQRMPLFDESDSAEEAKGAVKIAKPSSSLFDESDDGSDDLFKSSAATKKPATQKTAAQKPTAVEKKSQPKPIAQPVKPSSSLFSSDEEESLEDDIFGRTKTKIIPKKLDSARAKPSTNLFEDLSDDDDDLFGTSKKKHGGAEKSKSKPQTAATQPTKTSVPTKPKTANSNNPLSDLLGP